MLFLTLLLALSSCLDKNAKPVLPAVNGELSEVLLLMPEQYWNGPLGNAVKDSFADMYPSLPQIENSCSVIQIPPSLFDGIFLTHRNVISFRIKNGVKPTMTIQKDTYAKTQVIVGLEASSIEELISLFNSKSAYLVQYFLAIERKRLMDSYKSATDLKISEHLKSKYNLYLAVPRGYLLSIDKPGFTWISNETEYFLLGIFVYSYDYTDTAQLSKERLIAKRNEVLQKYVPGRVEKSYMGTEMQFPIDSKRFEFEKNSYYEIRGLWRMLNGDFMGGPFINVSIIDVAKNKIIGIDAYAFAPNKDKRALIQQLEAILYSAKAFN